MRGAPDPQPQRDNLGQQTPPDSSCEPLSDLRLLFRKKHKILTRDIQPRQSLDIRAHLYLQAKTKKPSLVGKILVHDHYSLANTWAMHPKLSGVLGLQSLEFLKLQTGVAQGCEQPGRRPVTMMHV